MRKIVKLIALILVIVGGLNWGLVGFFNFNLVESIFGVGTGFTRFIYDLVGLSAVVILLIEFIIKDKKAMEMKK